MSQGQVIKGKTATDQTVSVRVDDEGRLVLDPISVGGATSEEQIQQEYILEEIAQALQAIASTRGVLADLRVSIVGGAVTTVTTLTNQAQVGGYSANNEIPALMNIAAIQSNINNVVVT